MPGTFRAAGKAFSAGGHPVLSYRRTLKLRGLVLQPNYHRRARNTSLPGISCKSTNDDETAADISTVSVTVDNDIDEKCTKVTLEAPNRPGLLQAVTNTFRDLNLEVVKAMVDTKGGTGGVSDIFYVTDSSGKKLVDQRDVTNLKACLDAVFSAGSKPLRQRPDLTAVTSNTKKDLLYTLMGLCRYQDLSAMHCFVSSMHM